MLNKVLVPVQTTIFISVKGILGDVRCHENEISKFDQITGRNTSPPYEVNLFSKEFSIRFALSRRLNERTMPTSSVIVLRSVSRSRIREHVLLILPSPQPSIEGHLANRCSVER